MDDTERIARNEDEIIRYRLTLPRRATMTLKRLREHRRFVATVDPEDGHWRHLYRDDMTECLTEIERLRHVLIRARHYAKCGNIDVVREIVTSALFEPGEDPDGG